MVRSLTYRITLSFLMQVELNFAWRNLPSHLTAHLMSKKLPENKQPLLLGLTGGIGTGKSVVAKIFQALGIPVFNSDLQARTILEDDDKVREEIIALLGQNAYKENMPDRPYIAAKIFADEGLRAALNRIVHPAVGIRFENWIKKNSKSPYLLKEAAILFETGIYKSLDKTLLVRAPKDVRVDRIMDRDGLDREKIEERMNAQWPEEKKSALADYIISNDGSEALIPQVLEIHRGLLASLED